MRKYLLTGLLFFTLLASFSNELLKPDSKLYKEIEIWENKGYINNLPPQRPYPLSYLNKILNIVEVNGSESDAKNAKDYITLLNKNDFYIEGLGQFYMDSRDKVTMSGAYIGGYGSLGKYVHATGEFGLFLNNKPEVKPFSKGENYEQDFFIDESDIGSFQILSLFDSNLSLGTENLWLQMGILRNSYGPFYDDNIFMSADAPQAGHINFVWNTNKFIFTNTVSLLTATKEDGIRKYPEKYLIMRGYNYSPFNWLEVGFTEAIVFGERFEMMYTIPLVILQQAQGQVGFYDNYIMGFTSKVKLPLNINLKSGVYADDLHLNDLIRFNFNTKLKLAMQHELSWTPESRFLSMAKATYQLATPYMYTHHPYVNKDTDNLLNNINYLSYTNHGVSIGSNLEPNSDRVRVDVKTKLPLGINVNLFGSFSRHGNVSAIMTKTDGGIEYIVDKNGDWVYGPDANTNGIEDPEERIEAKDYIKDGSILDHGYVYTNPDNEYWQNLAQRDNPFLIQDVIEYTIQGGISLEKTFTLFNNPLTASVDYTLQYIDNLNCVKNNKETQHFIGVMLKYTL